MQEKNYSEEQKSFLYQLHTRENAVITSLKEMQNFCEKTNPNNSFASREATRVKNTLHKTCYDFCQIEIGEQF